MDSELRKNIRLRWFQSLFELSNYELQKKVWLEGAIVDYFSDYTEAICSYFDDLDLGSGLEKFAEDGFITKDEAKLFLDFHKQFREYTSRPDKRTLSDSKILRDIEWKNLTILAKQNWDKLKEMLTDKAELDYINNLEDRFANVT
ncbi:hypothetical protein [Flavobacterium sp.]|uniref:hypothetical protein n=1 Tax=Flavobacterium sp. TaxID=239 RepID=UPI00286B3C83|nr:hypothetical protein [Flavobacterium sp.]